MTTHAVRLLTYEQGIESFRVTNSLINSDRATLMGGTLTRVYHWTRNCGRRTPEEHVPTLPLSGSGSG